MAEGFKDFAAGGILAAADVDDYMVRQGVMRFADAAARDAALTAGIRTEGMVTFLKDVNAFSVYTGAAWVEFGRTEVWTAHSPTLTQGVTVAKTDTYCTYNRIGRQITYSGRLTVTGTGSASTIITLTLPVAIAAAAAGQGKNIGTAAIFDASAGGWVGAFCQIHTSATVMVFPAPHVLSAFAGVAGGLATGLAVGDMVDWNVTYEAAS